MNFQDQTLQCRDCGKDFVWTASEQEFYNKKGFDNAPVRCPDCRRLKKQRMHGGDRDGGGGGHRGGGGGGDRESFPITCSNCGKEDTVPFKPSGDRPVLCRDCFQAQRQG